MTKPFDSSKIGRDFPILSTQIGGRPLVYLDNAASTQKPQQVIDAISHFYQGSYANIHRGAHTLSHRATDAYEGARANVANFLGAETLSEIVFVRGTTEAINLVATCMQDALSVGDEIVVTELEHHSNLVPWQRLARATRCRLRVVPLTDSGALRLDVYDELLTDKTKIVALAHVSNSLGTVNPLLEMIEKAKHYGSRVVVDGAQGAVHFPVDVQALGCDAYAFSAHKLYGPTGVGVLYGSSEFLKTLPPYQSGGGMVDRVDLEGATFLESPFRFEAGTPNIAGAIGLSAAIDYIGTIGLEAIAAHERSLLEYASQQVLEVPGLQVIGQAAERAGLISFVMAQAHASDVATLLDEQGIAVRAGHHCAQPVMKRFGVPATVRASFALYNRHSEIDALVAALKKVVDIFA